MHHNTIIYQNIAVNIIIFDLTWCPTEQDKKIINNYQCVRAPEGPDSITPCRSLISQPAHARGPRVPPTPQVGLSLASIFPLRLSVGAPSPGMGAEQTKKKHTYLLTQSKPVQTRAPRTAVEQALPTIQEVKLGVFPSSPLIFTRSC